MKSHHAFTGNPANLLNDVCNLSSRYFTWQISTWSDNCKLAWCCQEAFQIVAPIIKGLEYQYGCQVRILWNTYWLVAANWPLYVLKNWIVRVVLSVNYWEPRYWVQTAVASCGPCGLTTKPHYRHWGCCNSEDIAHLIFKSSEIQFAHDIHLSCQIILGICIIIAAIQTCVLRNEIKTSYGQTILRV